MASACAGLAKRGKARAKPPVHIVPHEFVQQQRAYFAEVDAFQLEEESPPPKVLDIHGAVLEWENGEEEKDVAGYADDSSSSDAECRVEASIESIIADRRSRESLTDARGEGITSVASPKFKYANENNSSSKYLEEETLVAETGLSVKLEQSKEQPFPGPSMQVVSPVKISDGIRSCKIKVLLNDAELKRPSAAAPSNDGLVDTQNLDKRNETSRHGEDSGQSLKEIPSNTVGRQRSNNKSEKNKHVSQSGRGLVSAEKENCSAQDVHASRSILTAQLHARAHKEFEQQLVAEARTAGGQPTEVVEEDLKVFAKQAACAEEDAFHSAQKRLEALFLEDPSPLVKLEKLEGLLEPMPALESIKGTYTESEVIVDSLERRQASVSQLLPTIDGFLRECQQDAVISLQEAFTEFCELDKVVKLGEGTYGEAFRGGDLCFKVVPMGGDIRVNGELQKTMEEMLNEVLLTTALEQLRQEDKENNCQNFIETKGVRICSGKYEPRLIKAWEAWDRERESENDHPMIFSGKQLYTVFVFADGGRDLEAYSLKSHAEARSILLQTVLALAAAENACGFEHRDLHWGNILVAATEAEEQGYRLDGVDLRIATCGIHVSLIDFTLSRLEAGDRILFYDLSADPEVFAGPSRDIQFDTYRRMLAVTGGSWEGSHPKTNCLWLHYLADILLNKKAYPCKKDEKYALRAFRKRVLTYQSAAAAVEDEYFENLWVKGPM